VPGQADTKRPSATIPGEKGPPLLASAGRTGCLELFMGALL
jgi:hypothetical protein